MNSQNENTQFTIHPEYGAIELNVWKPVYAHRTCKKSKISEIVIQPNYEIMFNINKELPFIIRNKKTKNYINCWFEYYNLCHNKINIGYHQTHIALASAFPTITPKYTIDHINEDHTDNRITNLIWMEQSENSRKGQKKSVKNSNENGGRKGKYVIMKKPDPNNKKNRNKSITIGLFRSIDKCATFIINNVIQKDIKPKIKTVSAKIRRAIENPSYTAYNYYYDAFEIQIENEEWKQHPKYPAYQFSTHGRFRNSQGIIGQQINIRNGAKYKQVSINDSKQYIHKLVWETWYGEIPEGMDIMHDDDAPLCEDGLYRNWLCDLSIGTRSENMRSFHKSKLKAETETITENNITTNIISGNNITEEMPEPNIFLYKRTFPNNPLGDLMRNVPLGIQYVNKTKNRGSKYTLSRLYSKQKSDISSTGKSKITDEEKFLEVLKLYQENCLKEKQNNKYMKINVEDYRQYIP
jgi:hypothetical protein